MSGTRDRVTQALLLAAAVAVPLLGSLMSTDGDGRVAFAGLEAYPLPPLCPSRWVGLRCPTCGVTRSIVALMGGDWAGSLRFHRFGWLILGLILCQIPYRAWRVARPEGRAPWLERLGVASAVAAGVVVLVNRVAEAVFA
ncbi:MAG TPA: DUF2752 domain-containing protein [Planctomycetaceae bacterium]